VVPGPQVFAAGPRIVESARPLRIPAVYPFEETVEAGGLMSYAGDVLESYRRAARYVDLILKGANPAELPIEQPTRLALVINMATAKAQGIALPPSLLARADRRVGE
jgi:putative ABC transport system substrate-binding protein